MIRISGFMAFQRHCRIDQRFSLFDRGIADRHVHDVGAKPLTASSKDACVSRGSFKEKVYLRTPRKEGFFLSACRETATAASHAQARARYRAGKDPYAEQMPVRENRMLVGSVIAVAYMRTCCQGQACIAAQQALCFRWPAEI